MVLHILVHWHDEFFLPKNKNQSQIGIYFCNISLVMIQRTSTKDYKIQVLVGVANFQWKFVTTIET
jgi:hypothetical protein